MPLTTTDKRDLTESRAKAICDRIRGGIESVAELLVELHDGKGWIALGYKSWKECCEKEFRHSASWACRQIQCHEVNAALPIGTDLSESQARELAKVPEEKREEVLEAAGENPTAKAIKEAAAAIDYKCPECGCIECDDDGDCSACHAPATAGGDHDWEDGDDDHCHREPIDGTPDERHIDDDDCEAEPDQDTGDVVFDYVKSWADENNIDYPRMAVYLESAAAKLRGMA